MADKDKIIETCPYCGKSFIKKNTRQVHCKSEDCAKARRRELFKYYKDMYRKDPNSKHNNRKTSITEVREMFNLPKYKSKKIVCTQCGEKFKSWDVTQNRTCDKCKKKIEELGFDSAYFVSVGIRR